MGGSLVSKFSREMFAISYSHFRKVMCSNKYTLEQKDNVFTGLAQDYIRCNLEDGDMVAFVALEKEWSMRRVWEELRELEVRP